MRDLKNNILQNDETLEYFLDSANNKVDVIMDEFEDKPIQSASELKTIVIQNDEVQRQAHSLIQSTKRLINKGKIENDRRRALVELENLRDSLLEIRVDDFEELTVDEILDAKDIIMEIKDILYRLKKEI